MDGWSQSSSLLGEKPSTPHHGAQQVLAEPPAWNSAEGTPSPPERRTSTSRPRQGCIAPLMSLERTKHAPALPTSRYLQLPLPMKNMDTLGLIHRSWGFAFQSRQCFHRSEQTRVEKGLSAAPSSCSSKPTTEPWWVAETKLQACCHITPVQTVYCPLDASPCQRQYPNFSCYKQRLSEPN